MGLVTAAVVGAGVAAAGSAYAAHQNASATKDAANTMAAASRYQPVGIASSLGLSQMGPNGQASISLNNDPQNVVDQGYQNAGQMGGLLSNFAQQFGSFDPQQAAQEYTTKLNALSARSEGTAANSLASRLYSSGSLGSTGGQGMFQNLMDSQNTAQTQRDIAGMQYGQQAQTAMIGQAQGISQIGQSQLGGSLGIQEAAQSQLGLGAQMGSAQSAAGINGTGAAAQLRAQGTIDQNNAYNSMFQEALNTGMSAYKSTLSPPPAVGNGTISPNGTYNGKLPAAA